MKRIEQIIYQLEQVGANEEVREIRDRLGKKQQTGQPKKPWWKL
jgi:hypothetical protein